MCFFFEKVGVLFVGVELRLLTDHLIFCWLLLGFSLVLLYCFEDLVDGLSVVWAVMDNYKGVSNGGVKKIVYTVFVDNLPKEIDKVWLYQLFRGFGHVDDIYFCNKRNSLLMQKTVILFSV